MIQVSGACKTYQTGKIRLEALKDINIDIPDGDNVVLFGPSGSGKTTLLNLIGAMDRPTSGMVVVDGEEISGYSSARLTRFRAEKIGFIFQSPNLVPALNVYENVTVPMRLKGHGFHKQDVLDLIRRVGLGDHISHRPDELSGGQRQRVSIARALVHKPPYVIADEPTANLDSRTSEAIIDLLKELNAKLGVTLLFSSHDRIVYDRIPNRVLLRDGQIISETEGGDDGVEVH